MSDSDKLHACLDDQGGLREVSASLQKLPSVVDWLQQITATDSDFVPVPHWFDLVSQNGRRLGGILELQAGGDDDRRWSCQPNQHATWLKCLPRLLPGWVHDALQPVAAVSHYACAGKRVTATQAGVADSNVQSLHNWFESIEASITVVTQSLVSWRKVVMADSISHRPDVSTDQRLSAAIDLLSFWLRGFRVERAPDTAPQEVAGQPAMDAGTRRSEYDQTTLSLVAFLYHLVAPSTADDAGVRGQLLFNINTATQRVRTTVLHESGSRAGGQFVAVWSGTPLQLTDLEFAEAERIWAHTSLMRDLPSCLN
ncbi:MAG: hypothetical protein KDA92_04125 [Planctomycetales bacterium]|nr:hypothetical protein [Planctomycetales bacterium]MCA9166479.1 hypothetical protein [Planctomycetales bacterium]